MNVNIRFILICTIIVLLVSDNAAEPRRSSSSSSRRGSGGSYRGSNTRTTARPRGSNYGSGGSEPGKIGWNVPEKKPTNTNFNTKPSAPESTIGKTSATNVQSGYNPSGGYPRQPSSNPYHQNQNQGYNPSVGQGYNPSIGTHTQHGNQPYNPSYNPSYNSYPSHNQPYSPSMGSHPSYGGQPYGHSPYGGSHVSPSFGQTPQQAVVLQPVQASRPGIGQLAKEAFVFAGVSAGVNAAVNRILPGGIYGTHGMSSGGGGGGGGGGGSSGNGGGGTTHTEIHNTYYYNNGSAVPAEGAQTAAGSAPNPIASAAPAPNAAQGPAPSNQNNAPDNNKRDTPTSQEPPSSPNPSIPVDNDLKRLTEELYTKDSANNAFKHITINLQGQKKDDSTSDDAPEALLTVKPEAYEIPTVKAVIALHDNYEMDVSKREDVTPEERREESELLDKFLETEVMKSTMKYLSSKGYVQDDEYEFKDTLKRIWFSQFKRMDGDASSSGFETVYLAEQFESEIIGLHNWIYYARQEANGKIDYLGYIKQSNLGDKGSIIKLRSKVNSIVQPVTTIFVGTSPELEMALYTLCFFTQPSSPCHVSLGGTEFIIVANRVNYFGKDIIISGYPEI